MGTLSQENDRSSYPKRIAIIGGGRWAKEIISVLDRVTPTTTSLSLHSRHFFEANKSWIAKKTFLRSPNLVGSYRDFPTWTSCVSIIVNAARDHQSAAESCLLSGYPTLIEKPFTMSASGTQRLINLSATTGTKLAAAHVFAYSPSINRFGKLVRKIGTFESVRVEWADSLGEKRHGQAKQYDPSLPLHADILPHIVSIFSVIFPDLRLHFDSLTVEKGGAKINLLFDLGGIPCTILLIRNSKQRLRGIEITQQQGSIKLDFSEEPGTIHHSYQVSDVSPKTRPVSLARMLRSFLRYASGGYLDKRLHPSLALRANMLIDTIFPHYSKAQFSWLRYRLSNSSPLADKEDLLYFLSESVDAYREITQAELNYLHRHLRTLLQDNPSTIENSLRNNSFRKQTIAILKDFSQS